MATRSSPPGWWKSSAGQIMHKYNNKAPVDLDAIARELGVDVVRMPLGEHSGKIVRTEADEYPKFTIYVNSDHPLRRQRFSLAHELAHFMLHRDLFGTEHVDDAMYRSKLDDSDPEYERQANRFAADILMPVTLFVSEWRRLKGGPDKLADSLQVSRRAVDIRLKWLVARKRLPPSAAPSDIAPSSL